MTWRRVVVYTIAVVTITIAGCIKNGRGRGGCVVECSFGGELDLLTFKIAGGRVRTQSKQRRTLHYDGASLTRSGTTVL